MEARITEALAVMDEVHRGVLTEDMPRAKLGPVVDAAVAALGVSPAREAAGDSLSGAVLGWLAGQDRQEQRITWGGTALTLTLTVGAILASGGWLAVLGMGSGAAVGLGAAGSAVGFGEAVYSAERAGDLHAAGGASGAGAPHALVADPESARVQYALAALNLALAGLDLGVVGRGLVSGSVVDELAGAGSVVDELAGAGSTAAARLEGAVAPEVLARLEARLGGPGLDSLARGLDAAGFAGVVSRVDEATLAALVGKGLDGYRVRELVEGMGPAELRALAATRSGAELAAQADALAFARLRGEAGELRRVYLKGKPAGKGNAATAELALDDGTTLRSQATSKTEPLDRPVPRRDGGLFEPSTDIRAGRVMDTDAEYKVYDELARQLFNRFGDGAVEVVGRLRLYTEMSHCMSCTRVKEQFEMMFPNIEVEIAYDLAYDAR